jgi:uncharacterized protein DUF4180
VTVTEHNGVRIVEGAAGASLMSIPRDVNGLIETCFSSRSRCALLYASNLTPAFFDLSSREAGEILQKLRNYHIRLAVVVDPARSDFSSRFGEMVAEEKKGHDFGVFDAREPALAWLGATDG